MTRIPEDAPDRRPDPVLGSPYFQQDLPITSDRRGPTKAVLIGRERDGEPSDGRQRPAILMLHGWSDYIFHRDVLEHLYASGFDVWGLDLRRYGRASDGEVATAIDSLQDYDEELHAALGVIGPGRPVFLLAHSTGGLTAVRFAQRYPGILAGLILNSPWLAFHLGATARKLLLPGVRKVAAWRGDGAILPRGTSSYARSVHRDFDGDATFDFAWKPAGGHKFPAVTFAAVLEAQEALISAPPLELPILVLHSTRSNFTPWYLRAMAGQDVVLDVRSMHRVAHSIGPHVSIVPIEGAVHDVFLSRPHVRSQALRAIDQWLGRLRVVYEARQAAAPGSESERGSSSEGDPGEGVMRG